MNAITEALKEAGRVVVLAIIPVLIDGLTKGVVDFKMVAVVAMVAALRFLDSWLHKSGVAEKGITRF